MADRNGKMVKRKTEERVMKMRFDFVDVYNVVVGAIVAVLSAIFGIYWYLIA